MMLSLRWLVWVAAACACVATANKSKGSSDDFDYLDDVKEYSAHHSDDISAKYSARLNKIDMLDDYPHDDDFHDDFHDRYYEDDDEDEDDEDYDDEDEGDDEDDDSESGGCGGGDDDDEDDDDEEEDTLSPVQETSFKEVRKCYCRARKSLILFQEFLTFL
ncbi:coiled-coil domain-containing protein 1-like [Cherax quadricarinatus]|uniref:coiled-coil domain-containing protein 1-like n=1 Tax=Cherax quadricarinatus TaxID=27406 RepID=UPI00387EA98D